MNKNDKVGRADNGHWVTEYLTERQTIAVTGAGPITDVDGKRHSEQAMRLLNEKQAALVLVDYSEALPEVSVAVLYWLPRFYKQLGVPGPTRIALVLPRAPFRMESFQFYALACRKAGYNVKLFETRKAAEGWLGEKGLQNISIG